MGRLGSEANPLRVAIVGSGPAGFYTADHLLKAKDVSVEIDMFERLPTPFGLVRFGVAPDHQKIKNVVKVYGKTAQRPEFRFYGNCEFGAHITLDDLKRSYHAIVFSTGAQTDKQLGIPGEDLARSHPATEFVAWYNGHPDFVDCTFDLSVERAVVIGVGNVAVDVCRVLCRTVDELAKTDIADYALEALAESKICEVWMLGRRGPAQAAFTPPEARELGELEGADVFVHPHEAELDPVSLASLEGVEDKDVRRKLDIIQSYAGRESSGKPRRLVLRFLTSPTELHDDGSGRVGRVTLVRNELVDRGGGRLSARATDDTEVVDAGLVFRSVGYRGVPLPDVPFRDDWGTVPNDRGRVQDSADGEVVRGLYVSGWIKRGPSGVIGTNRPDAGETVAAIIEDLESGSLNHPTNPSRTAVDAVLASNACRVVTFDDWQRLDAAEVSRGEASGRPRVKLTSVEEMLGALDS